MVTRLGMGRKLGSYIRVQNDKKSQQKNLMVKCFLCPLLSILCCGVYDDYVFFFSFNNLLKLMIKRVL